jgi:hypothetical protein
VRCAAEDRPRATPMSRKKKGPTNPVGYGRPSVHTVACWRMKRGSPRSSGQSTENIWGE